MRILESNKNPSRESLEKAVQLWTLPEHSHKVLDHSMATSIARLLDERRAREFRMGDTVLHTILGLVLLFAFATLVLSTPAWIAMSTLVGVFLFLRELTQEQTKKYDSDFFSGWNPFRWSGNKNIETWVPVLVVAVVAWSLS